jgi:hypothetical protein
MLALLLIATGCGGGSSAHSSQPGSNLLPAAGTPTGSPPPASAPTTTPGSTNPNPVPPGATLTTYHTNLAATANWVVAHSVLPDGAILYTPNKIVPYYGNIAAIGMTKDPTKFSQVRAWMDWYLRHLNAHDVWGLGDTIYDYTVSGNTETPMNDADSTDSYPATFLTLAWNFYQTGDPSAQAYVKSVATQLDHIGQSLVRTQQNDGLTWAKLNYQIKFLMDNCESYRGLRDAASLFQALGNSGKASFYNSRADLMFQGIWGMWLGHAWATYKDNAGNLAPPKWLTWYADSVAQLYPLLEQVIPASDPKAQEMYWRFNTNWAGWPNLSFNTYDPFPWVLVSKAAALMGDSARVDTYIVNIQNLYVDKNFPWPWYSMEAGFFMQVNGYMAGEGF